MDSINIIKGGSTNFDELIKSTTETISPINSPINYKNDDGDSSDDDDTPAQRTKKRIRQFSDSDDNTNKENVKDDTSDSDSGMNNETSKSILFKSRTRITLQNESDSESEGITITKNTEQQMRLKNKNNKIKEKFKNLLQSRKHENKLEHENSDVKNTDSNSAASDEDISSIENIKQKIKERTTFVPSLCDPDTSDEENSQPKMKPIKKKERKTTRPTSPKPMRMSSKQAVENMQKIKSESNRMLREKEVSLPYHRPKALSLKDIMSRRKPALNAEGKALPIKMNEDQLKEYVLQLEQRQKEMMELCKSDTDEENDSGEPLLATGNSGDNVLEELVDKKVTKSEEFSLVYEQVSDKDQLGIDNVPETNLLGNTVEKTQNPGDKADLLHEEDPNTSLTNIDNHNSNILNNTKTINFDDNLENIMNNEDKEEKNALNDLENNAVTTVRLQNSRNKPETESQLIQLHYDSESMKDSETLIETVNEPSLSGNIQHSKQSKDVDMELPENNVNDFTFSDDEDLDINEIDKLIEDAEIIHETQNNVTSLPLVRDPQPSKTTPKLVGAPGTVIDLDKIDELPKKALTGVELLKERFSYFARIKTPEELEREKEKTLKPGSLHLRLKQQLEDQIAEQRSLEWAKRLEEEKQQQLEMKALRGEELDEEDDIEKIEAKLEDKVASKEIEEESSSSEEELIEDDIIIKDKPRVKNAMLDEEAVESDCDEDVENNEIDGENHKIDSDNIDEDDNSEDSEDDDSSEDEETTTCKKGRILKAFEDSDDEESNKTVHESEGVKPGDIKEIYKDVHNFVESETYTQDDEIQLGQKHKSEDFFTSQESDKPFNNSMESDTKDDSLNENRRLGVFSITNKQLEGVTVSQPSAETCGFIDTQFVDDNFIPISETNLEPITQSLLPSQLSTPQSQSQPIGEDVLALCTGKFYDNEFISPPQQNYTMTQETTDCESQELSPMKIDDNKDTLSSRNKIDKDNDININANIKDVNNLEQSNNKDEIMKNIEGIDTSNKTGNNTTPNAEIKSIENEKSKSEDSNILKSILDELNDPEFDSPKPNKYFVGDTKKNLINSTNNMLKKKFVIDSDDDEDATVDDSSARKKKKKLKKKKPEKRALQISDDEEEDDVEDEEEYVSDVEEASERIVEYDSEENEVEVNTEKPKKKRKVADFFEQEAELTSEDEWVGSGDEDEADLDRMEREEGDNEQFNQGQLQRELEQIHMRDVLDQDKREVRIIQELLFEDGDLGAGSRQRKFRWKNADGEDETGVINDDCADTQEEEFESEEQWRKQRHEREVFLRQMKNEKELKTNTSVNRTSIIKANLSSKTMSNVLLEASVTETSKIEKPVPIEKKSSKDIPSPKKPFAIFQQNYHGSLLTRGRGALARLAALATPLAVDEDAPKIGSLAPSSKRNFVFAALSQKESKATKRKADNVDDTPKLVKKMKLDEKRKYYKNSLLDHLKV